MSTETATEDETDTGAGLDEIALGDRCRLTFTKSGRSSECEKTVEATVSELESAKGPWPRTYRYAIFATGRRRYRLMYGGGVQQLRNGVWACVGAFGRVERIEEGDNGGD